LHFPEDMIISYGQKRRLKDDAMPILCLLNANIVTDSASTNSFDNSTITALQTSDKVEGNSEFEPIPSTSAAEVQHIDINTR